MIEAAGTMPPPTVALGGDVSCSLAASGCKTAWCSHRPRYRVCLAAALGMSEAVPATPLPCGQCEQVAKSTSHDEYLRWRTSSATSSQGTASTRAPTACGGDDDRASWTSSFGGHSSLSTSSTHGYAPDGSALLRTSSSSMTTIDGTQGGHGEYYCPTPTQRFWRSLESDESGRYSLYRSDGGHQEYSAAGSSARATEDVRPSPSLWDSNTRPPPTIGSPLFTSPQSPRLFAMALSHAASFIYEE